MRAAVLTASPQRSCFFSSVQVVLAFSYTLKRFVSASAAPGAGCAAPPATAAAGRLKGGGRGGPDARDVEAAAPTPPPGEPPTRGRAWSGEAPGVVSSWSRPRVVPVKGVDGGASRPPPPTPEVDAMSTCLRGLRCGSRDVRRRDWCAAKKLPLLLRRGKKHEESRPLGAGDAARQERRGWKRT